MGLWVIMGDSCRDMRCMLFEFQPRWAGLDVSTWQKGGYKLTRDDVCTRLYNTFQDVMHESLSSLVNNE